MIRTTFISLCVALALGACSGEQNTSTQDAGGSDAGTSTDAGEAPDAGGMADAGEAPDAGGTADAGEAPDAGVTTDAGTPVTLVIPPPNRLSSGTLKTCALRDDGQARCWGRQQSMPALLGIEQVGALSEIALTTMDGACGLRADGSIVCVGDHFAANTPSVVPVPSATGFRSLSAGSTFACAIATSDKKVHCWGTPTDTVMTVPTFEAHDVAAGLGFACALNLLGELTCWGSATAPVLPAGPYEEIGASGGYVCGRTPQGLVRCNGNAPAVDKVFRRIRVDVGGGACGILADGSVSCWAGASNVQNVPSGTFVEVAPSFYHACARTTGGEWQCWGGMEALEGRAPVGGAERFWLGQESCIEFTPGNLQCTMGNQPPATFTARPSNFAQLTGVSIARDHACGLEAGGSPVCWGNNSGGQATPPAGMTFTAVSVAPSNTCGLASDGSVTCWGTGTCVAGQTQAGPFTKMCATYNAACGIKSDGTVECWGCDIGTPPAATTFTELACGFKSACGIKSDGTIACWGYPNNANMLQQIPSGAFVEVRNWEDSNLCARRADGSVACWGWDPNMQGIFRVPDLRFSSIQTGWATTCGVTTTGKAACWGNIRRTPLD
jgi:alpha-tubulin suppressor-like RCC1 family protein